MFRMSVCAAYRSTLCCSVLQCVAVCCSVLQCVAVCCGVLQSVSVCSSVLQLQFFAVSVRHSIIARYRWQNENYIETGSSLHCSVLQCVAVCCSAMQYVALGYYVLPCVAVRCSCSAGQFYMRHVGSLRMILQLEAVYCSVLQCIAVYCSVLQCVAVCCDVLYLVAMHCSVLQCGAVHSSCSAGAVLHMSRIWEYASAIATGSSQHCSVLQCVALCCTLLQCIAVRCRVLPLQFVYSLMYVIYTWQYANDIATGSSTSIRPPQVCCSVLNMLQWIALCCNVLQCVAMCCGNEYFDSVAVFCILLQAAAGCWMLLLSGAVCCSVLQTSVAACCRHRDDTCT